MGPKAGLDGCGESRPHWDCTRGPSAIPPQLSRPTITKADLTKFEEDSELSLRHLPRDEGHTSSMSQSYLKIKTQHSFLTFKHICISVSHASVFLLE